MMDAMSLTGRISGSALNVPASAAPQHPVPTLQQLPAHPLGAQTL